MIFVIEITIFESIKKQLKQNEYSKNIGYNARL